MNESAFDFGDILSGFKRRAWVLAACIIVVTPIVLLVALLLPPYYSSTSRILVQSQTIPSDLVRSTVNVAASERLELIRQRLTTRTNLLSMADRLQLFEDKPHMSSTDVVEAIRESIEVEEIALRTNRRSREQVQAAAFTVTYSSRDPVIAARVANELVTMVLQENLEARSKRAQATREFLENKTRDLSNELNQIEGQIASFKIEKRESLPASLAQRQDELVSLRERVYELRQQKITLEERRRALQEGIAAGVIVEDEGETEPLSPNELKLAALERELAEARGIFTSNHPKIRALSSRIGSLKATIIAEQARLAGTAKPVVDAQGAAQRLRTTQERTLALLERQNALVAQQLESANTRVKQLETSIAATPDTEIALRALERRRAELDAQHREAALKAAAAIDGEELELNRQAERYEILEQAQIPEDPDSPPRKLIAAGGFGGSIALGFGLMLLLELMNRTIRTSRHLATQVGLSPIVSVPMIRTVQERAKRRLTAGAYALILIGTAFGVVFLIDQYVTPVDRLVANLLDDAQLTPIVEEARMRFAGAVDGFGDWVGSLGRMLF